MESTGGWRKRWTTGSIKSSRKKWHLLALSFIILNFAVTVQTSDVDFRLKEGQIMTHYLDGVENKLPLLPQGGPSHPPARQIIVVSLSAESRPQHVFTMHSNNTEFIFDISSSRGLFEHDFKMSIVVEKMKCYQIDGRNPPFLVIQGIEENKTIKICSEINNERNHFQTVEHLMDNIYGLTVRTEGDWTDLNAQLVASIYYEVPSSCGNCAEGYFCCGFKGGSCTGRTVRVNWANEILYRCIPKTALLSTGGGGGGGSGGGGFDRTNDLICNRHPNCGFYCNLDESRAKCDAYFDGCIGEDCHLADVALKIALLILFCFLAPPVFILVVCRLKSVRGFCDRINHRVSTQLRDRTGSNSTIGSADEVEQTVSTICRRDLGPVPTYNPSDDPPPSYEEYVRNFKIQSSDPPPPSFEEAVLGARSSWGMEVDRNLGSLDGREAESLRSSSPIITCEAVNISILETIEAGAGGGATNHAFLQDERNPS